MSVSVQEGAYKGWSVVTVGSGDLEFVLAPQVGGRIIGLKWRGIDRLFTQPEREGQVEDVASAGDLLARKREMGFPLWGGDKTWIGPQGSWTEAVPFLDLDSGSYELDVSQSPESGRAMATMVSPVCRETGIRITRRLTVGAGEGWTVEHTLTNEGDGPVSWAPWDVVQVLRPARVYLPRSGSSDFAGGVKTFDNEGESTTIRDRVVREFGSMAEVACEEPHAFKFGVDSPERSIVGVLSHADATLALAKRVVADRDGPSPHGCTAEVYNSDRYGYLEMELPGPVADLAPGQSTTMTEHARLVELPVRPTADADVVLLVP